MSISQKLCEVRDRDYGGKNYVMARAWDIHESTLSRWTRGERTPEAAWYDFLAERLDLSVSEIHELCKAGRGMLALNRNS